MNVQRVAKNVVLDSLIPEWPRDLIPEIKKQARASERKVVVLDDDPTGTQTVHNIPVLTEWSGEILQAELSNDLPVFYILTNSRSFTLPVAQSINTEIGHNLAEAARQVNRQYVVVSRSDSTLRGHFPGEVQALADALGQSFDGWIVNPFFLEGGRYTIGDLHYVEEGQWLVPAGETEFAKDSVFGYHSSNLCQWVEEKTGGQIASAAVISISIEDIRKGGPERVTAHLMELQGGSVCVVNAASYRDLEVFILGLLEAEARGKKFLYRTAASFVQVRSGLSPRPLLTKCDLDLAESGGGLIVVGSYVPKTTEQVNQLLAHHEISHAEVSVEALLDEKRRPDEIERVSEIADRAMRHGNDILIFTSRKLAAGQDTKTSLLIGQKISQAIITILQKISTTPRYILAKGGITSSDVATHGLQVKRALVCGQILPGVPVWKLGEESRYPGLVYIVFPGNVGNSNALIEVVNQLKPETEE
jgi:uncharacterized protein YgbK (DUF1537 family)